MGDSFEDDEEVEAPQQIDLSIMPIAGVCSWLLIAAFVTLEFFKT